MVRITGKKVSDRDKNHRAERRGCERIPKAAAKNSELHKDPSAYEGTDQAENDVRDATEATPRAIFPASQPAMRPIRSQPMTPFR